MTRVGATSPEMMRRVLSATRRVELQEGRKTSDENFQGTGRIVVRNVSAYTIPEFGLMQIKLAKTEGGRNVVEVERPFDQANRPSSVWLLNGPFSIEPNEFGTAQSGPDYRVKTQAIYPIGIRLGWQADSFQAIPGCLLTVIGTDDITTNVARVKTDFSMLHGIVTADIPANLSGEGEFQSTDPTTTHKVKTRGATVLVGREIYAWPSKGEWIVAGVC